ncbi:adenylate cyclase type 2-like [Centruroides vittatus]|uniref:adenylate cyclase type 2-like n=1 Tax=Centruroides vittatus TaxID=120091 RepID=UPI0035103EC2
MAGLELFTRNSLSSLRSSSESSILGLIPESLHPISDENSWSWSYLREQFRVKNAESLFHRYQARLQHAMFMVALMLNIFYNVMSIVIYLVFTENRESTVSSVSLSFRCFGLAVHLSIFIVAYKETWFKTDYSRIFVASIILLTMLVSEHGTSVYHLSKDTYPHHNIRHTFYIVIICFLLLPYPNIYQSAIAAAVTTAIELCTSVMTYSQDSSNMKLRIAADVTFYVIIISVCLCIKFLLEIINRRAFLDRRECFESKFTFDYEKDQEEQLLLSILPRHIAIQVREDIRRVLKSLDQHPLPQRPFNELYVEKHKNVSILYADIVNSMLLTASLDVSDLVETLNELFGRFDECAEKNNCMRIKLLGDCYYCVSGMPLHDPYHADHCVHMGLDMIEIIRKIRDERHVNVDMRIGIHSGNILSGLLGLKKWQFDIWSRDVTIASRMEQSGKAGRVHITNVTKNQLKGTFDFQPGNGHLRDPYLAEYHIETFLIVPPSKKPMRESIYESVSDGTFRIPNHLRKTSISGIHKNSLRLLNKRNGGSEILSSRKRTVLDYSLMQYRKMVSQVNKYMETGIENMALSKTDQWFRSEGIQPLLLMFRDCSLELPYTLLPDPPFKYYLFCVFLLYIGMITIHLITMARTFYFWVAYGTTFLVIFLSFVTAWTGYLWNKCQNDDTTNTTYSANLMTKISKKIVESIVLRVFLYIAITIMLLSCAMLGLNECLYPTTTNSNNSTDSNSTEEQFISCDYPWYYTFCAVLAMSASTVFLKIHFLVKFVVNFSALSIFCYLIFRQECDVFSRDKLHYGDWHDLTPGIGHCWYLTVVWFTLHVLDRQFEYVSRLDYLWKRKLREEQEETRSMGLLNKMLLQNILPVHVAEYYLRKDCRHLDELYHEEYTSVAVMFASIPNYMDFYTENIINDEGLRCLQLLNEIICDFDKLLYEQPFHKIEKIKTVGSTYMAAAGLQPGRSSQENDRVENPVANVLLLVRFATMMMATLQQMNKDAWQSFQLRIGIAVGPVIAGVVGAVKPQYDIWGDTVNMASRMDSTGIMGRIQVTQKVAEILMKEGNYPCECRGEIYVKGKGQIVTFIVKTQYDEGVEETQL